MKPLATAASGAPSEELLTRRQAAAYLGGLKPSTLAVWATTKRYRLPFLRIGNIVRYRRSDLDKFLESKLVSAGAEDE